MGCRANLRGAQRKLQASQLREVLTATSSKTFMQTAVISLYSHVLNSNPTSYRLGPGSLSPMWPPPEAEYGFGYIMIRSPYTPYTPYSIYLKETIVVQNPTTQLRAHWYRILETGKDPCTRFMSYTQHHGSDILLS